MPEIATVIIAHNEEKNIRRCIESLEGVTDEIWVIDSGSTDHTIDIAQGLGAKVVSVEWKGYSANKNHGNSLVKAPYILSLDADEALSPVLRQNILSQKPNLSGAYRFSRLTQYCGHWVRYCGWYPDKKIRLFPNDKAKWEGEYVHEKLILAPGTTVFDLKGDLLHYSIYSKEDHIDRAKTYAKLEAQRMFDRGKRYHPLKKTWASLSKFVKMYLFKLGFLDGKAGRQICWISAQEKSWRYDFLKGLAAKHKKA